MMKHLHDDTSDHDDDDDKVNDFIYSMMMLRTSIDQFRHYVRYKVL